jgi:hypothetical protein
VDAGELVRERLDPGRRQQMRRRVAVETDDLLGRKPDARRDFLRRRRVV